MLAFLISFIIPKRNGNPISPSISILQFLSFSLPEIPLQNTVSPGSTTDFQNSPDDLHQVVEWPEFNHAAILQKFGPVLNTVRVQPVVPGIPPGPIKSEGTLQSNFYELIRPRVRRALRVGSNTLPPSLSGDFSVLL